MTCPAWIWSPRANKWLTFTKDDLKIGQIITRNHSKKSPSRLFQVFRVLSLRAHQLTKIHGGPRRVTLRVESQRATASHKGPRRVTAGRCDCLWGGPRRVTAGRGEWRRAAASDGGPQRLWVAGAAASLTASPLVTRPASGYSGSGYSGRGEWRRAAASDSGHNEDSRGSQRLGPRRAAERLAVVTNWHLISRNLTQPVATAPADQSEIPDTASKPGPGSDWVACLQCLPATVEAWTWCRWAARARFTHGAASNKIIRGAGANLNLPYRRIAMENTRANANQMQEQNECKTTWTQFSFFESGKWAQPKTMIVGSVNFSSPKYLRKSFSRTTWNSLIIYNERRSQQGTWFS